MSEELYQAIARSESGYVEAPAGCGKTEAIARTVGSYCDGCQLVLTHTHAGVDVLRDRFRSNGVPQRKYHIDTIAAWVWGWVRMYPSNAGYKGSIQFAAWPAVYPAMLNLLTKDFVKQGILNSYAGVIVDEYQDCTVSMHAVIAELKRLLPCRVLGDELQGIFDFNERLVGWPDVRSTFQSNVGTLETPHRWIKAGNEKLGRWLLRERATFLSGAEPDYRGSPIQHRRMRHQDVFAEITDVLNRTSGRICVIGSKKKSLPASIETSLVKRKFRVLEPNDLSVLRELVESICSDKPSSRPKAAMKFFKRVFGGVDPDDQRFLQAILSNKGKMPRRADRLELRSKHATGVTPALLLDLLGYIEGSKGISCKLQDSVSALRSILEQHLTAGAALESLYSGEITQRKFQRRGNSFRCCGSTLLVKGLEFDHTVILRDPQWEARWGTHKDLYVALTRGSKSTLMIDLQG